MTHLIVQRCSDCVRDAEGCERTAQLWSSMQGRAEGYYVLVHRLGGAEWQAADTLVAGPFVRLRNAQAAAAEIERTLADSGPAMSLE